MLKLFLTKVLPAVAEGAYDAFKAARNGDRDARRRLIDIVGATSRLDLEHALDEAVIASLDE